MALDRGVLDENTHVALAPPTFDSVEAERAHRKRRLIGAYRIFARFGYDHWVAGHITVRDPEHGDQFWANPLGVSWHLIQESDLLRVDFDGNVLEGERPLNAAAFAIHSEIHRARHDVNAAAHAHTVYGRAWSATGRLLEPISQDHCAFYGDHAVFDDFTGAVYETAESRRFGDALGDEQGADPEEPRPADGRPDRRRGRVLAAPARALRADAMLLAQLHAEPGRPAYDVLSHDGRAPRAAQVGEPLHGWRGFQPLWDDLIAEQPELFSE